MSTEFRDRIKAFAATVRRLKSGKFQKPDYLKKVMGNLESKGLELVGPSDRHIAQCSVGQGGWASVAWLCIFDKAVTVSAQNGYYISMLFNSDLTSVYVGLGLGVTEYEGKIRTLDKHVSSLRERLRPTLRSSEGIIWDGKMDLGEESDRAKGFKRATVFTRKFSIDRIPLDSEMADYLQEIVQAHDDGLQLLESMQANDFTGGSSLPRPTSAEDDQDSDLSPFLLWSEEKERDALRLWERKRNIILQGPPGVGKTFWSQQFAERVNEAPAALSGLIGMGAPPRHIFRCQFHQSMSYEDFVEGYRPNAEGGFDLAPGIFRKAVETAMECPSEQVVLIVDEINRGNISKIFGELLSLIEADKRSAEWATTLPYSKDDFWVPDNLYIIGMMNTADRSISLVDYALRRRFGFVDVEPEFDNPNFKSYLIKSGVEGGLIEKIAEKLSALNRVISSAPHLGFGFQVGHSYFMSADSLSENGEYAQIIKYEIKPLLEEYWFDDPDMVQQLVDDLLMVN